MATENSTSQRRVLFYSHDGAGLGHLRITLAAARAYARLRPADSLLLLTGSLHVSAFGLPPNLDYIKFPAMPKRDLYASLPPTEGFTGSHNSTIRFRTSLALATVQAFDPDLIVVDHAPGGLFRELAPAIEWLLTRKPRPRFALLMRDITFGAQQTQTIWRDEGVYPLLDEVYDDILIYGDQRIFDPLSAYDMSAASAFRARFCGYLAPAAPRRTPVQVRQELGGGDAPLVVVSAGGGADGGPLMRAYLDGLRRLDVPPMRSYIVTGPLLPDEERRQLGEIAGTLPGVQIVEFDPDFTAVVSASDVVVSMAGYNSVTEAVFFGKRPVLAPRLPGAEEQLLRAEGFARIGLATVVAPATLSAETLWSAIIPELQRPPLTSHPLPFHGLERIADALAGPAPAGTEADL